MSSIFRLMPQVLLALFLFAAIGCRASTSASSAARPVTGDTGATTAATPEERTPTGHPADVRFMQDMIAHHAQAVLMTDMVPARTTNAGMKLLAERIAVSQADELQLMQQWLRGHGQPLPSASHQGHGAASHQMMPGMATEAELAALRAATGSEFDQLFLKLMIRHHEGALAMVAQLFNSAGAAQTSEMYQFATEVDGDQRAEISRMRTLLASLTR